MTNCSGCIKVCCCKGLCMKPVCIVLTTWRAHVENVTCIMVVEDKKMIVTASLDCCLRVWTNDGEYIGMIIYGVNRFSLITMYFSSWLTVKLFATVVQVHLVNPSRGTYTTRQHGSIQMYPTMSLLTLSVCLNTPSLQ